MIAILTFVSGLGCGFVLCVGLMRNGVRAALEDKNEEIATLRELVAYKDSVVRLVATERRATEELLYTRPHRRWNDNLVVGPWR